MSTNSEIYPFIQQVVDALALESRSFVSRDEIVSMLIENPDVRSMIADSLGREDASPRDLWDKAGNFVDWLNADITAGDPRSAAWNNGYYSRKKATCVHPHTGKKRSVYWLMPSAIEIESDLDGVLSDNNLTATERTALAQCRIGQGIFRELLINEFKGCPLTGCHDVRLLRASHIKPWRVCDNRERLDPFNGLLLSPNIDAAFDQGLISFDLSGNLLFSPSFSQIDAGAMGIHTGVQIELRKERLTYLNWHRKHVFCGE